MTSSNVSVGTATSAAAHAPQIPEPADAAPAAIEPTAPSSPFQLLPVGDTFGVCAVDGECR